jgi:HSP20 family protein
LADDLTAKARARERPTGGEKESHSERWTRAAPTRPDLMRQREVHRERLRHAGAGNLEENAQERRLFTMSDRDRMLNQRPAENRDNEERGLARREGSDLSGSGYGYSRGYSPFDLMRRFSEDVDRMFSRAGFPSMSSFGAPFESSRALGRPTGESGMTAWSPSVDVLTRGDDLVVCAELPGIKPDDVNVEVEGNNLVISGETSTESEKKDQGYWYSERRYGSFFRSIPLPPGVNADNAQANFNNGVLEITLPGAAKSLQSQRRRIEIEGQQAQGQRQQQAQSQPQEQARTENTDRDAGRTTND